MKEALTHHQEVVRRFMAQASSTVSQEFYEAFMKASLLALRGQGVPVTLHCRKVRHHLAHPKRHNVYALEVEGRPIGFKGSVGWKAIADEHAHPHQDPPAAAPPSYLHSVNKTEHVHPIQFRNNLVVRALLSKVEADLAANFLGSGDGTVMITSAPRRL